MREREVDPHLFILSMFQFATLVSFHILLCKPRVSLHHRPSLGRDGPRGNAPDGRPRGYPGLYYLEDKVGGRGKEPATHPVLVGGFREKTCGDAASYGQGAPSGRPDAKDSGSAGSAGRGGAHRHGHAVVDEG